MVLNAAVNAGKYEHTTPFFHDVLHWLPVRQWWLSLPSTVSAAPVADPGFANGGAKVERHSAPSPENFFDFRCKNVDF